MGKQEKFTCARCSASYLRSSYPSRVKTRTTQALCHKCAVGLASRRKHLPQYQANAIDDIDDVLGRT